MSNSTVVLSRRENQARLLAEYAIDFLSGRFGEIGTATLDRVAQFHLDSVGCAVSALSQGARAPTVLRNEALQHSPSRESRGGIVFGSARPTDVSKAVAANCSAVREWDSNGTNFGFDPIRGRTAGEFGHNDFYPVAIAAARLVHLDGFKTLRVMLLIDEIRGRLAEVFALRTYAIDHVHHGAVASVVAFSAAIGATVEQIESAIGLVVAHYVPFRAIRAGHQLSDSKGASAAFAAEMAIVSAMRAIQGFVGPRDVFRNPLAIYRFNEPTTDGTSPFDLELGCSGDAFAIHGMHFKLGLYEHQSAGAIEAMCELFAIQPNLACDQDSISQVRIKIYEPAYSIIADPAKRNPTTRQSADHSLPWIVARLFIKAKTAKSLDWNGLMLMPEDYQEKHIIDPHVRRMIGKIVIEHGGPHYDSLYPDGIPTSVEIVHTLFGTLSSSLVQYPLGHARSSPDKTEKMVHLKFDRLVAPTVSDVVGLRSRMRLVNKSAEEIDSFYAFPILGCDPDQ